MPLESADARVNALRQDLVDAQASLLATLDTVAEDAWSRPSPNEGWTVQSLLTHLSTAEVGFAGSLTRLASGGGGVPADFDPNRWNASQLRRRAETLPAQLRAELEDAHSRMLGLLGTVGDAELAQRGNLSRGGEGSLEDAFRLVARHKREHTRDIQAALDAPA